MNLQRHLFEYGCKQQYDRRRVDGTWLDLWSLYSRLRSVVEI